MHPALDKQDETEPRTLETLKQKLHEFQTDGNNDIKNAKFYDNVIDDVMFNVEIDQVFCLVEDFYMNA